MNRIHSASPERAPERLQRIVVVGCCGAGKSTFAARLASHLGIPHVERDALGTLGSDAYRRAVEAAIDAPGWVFDGPPYYVDPLVYTAAQTVIWLDYPRALVVWRATQRALRRTVARGETGEHGWRRLQQWVAPGGPRFAASVYTARRAEFRALAQHPEWGGKVVRFGAPAGADAWLEALS